MPNNDRQLIVRQMHSIYLKSKRTLILGLLLWCTGCTSKDETGIKLNLSVEPAGRSGSYSVTATTNLPNQSQIIVSAIRYLNNPGQEFITSKVKNNYAILDRQIVRVEDGKLQATLNLWQVAPDGRLQEAWQIERSQIGSSLEPGSDVSFIATFEPDGQLATDKQQKIQIPELKGSLVRFSNEGSAYIKASQTLRVSLPSGRRQPPIIKAEDVNDGWGNRYELKPEPPAPTNIRPIQIKNQQTNAPLSDEEFVR
ncbi:MAG TPA: hypothetical protein DEG17_12125 [Cyanobacteria bacterium UBA11149]|nr:hypothetical protein [Cyanobacteria bacterium UBA11367]HBE60552.1 hypothetical protein [Cyanobacteria bacterium UBA11366]HBK63782.1 hypothetical protein [Cyanobacteria bacterium UBA11166]HBR72888.1 hypothetical protein [Cyanobacteria bacterium UBA11159]HBS69001.1 hypothetical protein [Cyanobacteria bacterium UBA11153]HBW89594.1 hypothetical protein [Cyanobacteria bacterium UBA11149]HCA93391.1 hypothetical protein [Cyanobacteria bacterium UBA9226]